MKLLLITPLYPGYLNEPRSRAPYAVHYFAKEWVKQGHKVEVIRIWPYRPFPISLFLGKYMSNHSYLDHFGIDGVSIHRVPMMKFPALDYSNNEMDKAIKKIISSIQVIPDKIICHTILPSFYIGLRLSKYYNIPIYLTLHNSDLNYLSRKSGFKKFLKNESELNQIFFRSNTIKNKFNSIMNRDFKNNIISSGINKNEILSNEEFINKTKNKVYRFVIACTLNKNKRVIQVVKAIEDLKDKFNVELLIIGDGPEKKNLDHYVDENKLKKYVKMLGQLSRQKVLETMRLSDSFVMVSSPETFGLVYLEAMSKGCIVVGSRGEGIDGVIKDNYNGFLCEVDNTRELEDVMRKCITMDIKIRGKILENAYLTVHEYTQENLSQIYFDYMNK